MAYKSEDLDKWLSGIMAQQGSTGIADPQDPNSLSARYGLGSTNARWDDLANDLIDQANKTGSNLTHSQWQTGGLSNALRNAQNFSYVDAARGAMPKDANGQYDTSLGSANWKGRIADYLTTGSTFNHGPTGTGEATALGYQELPGAYKTIVGDIGKSYMGDDALGNYANNRGTEGGLTSLLQSIYGNSVASDLSQDAVHRGYRNTNQFQDYYTGFTGNPWDISSRSFTPPELAAPVEHQPTQEVSQPNYDQNLVGPIPANDPSYNAATPVLTPAEQQLVAAKKGHVQGPLGTTNGTFGGLTVSDANSGQFSHPAGWVWDPVTGQWVPQLGSRNGTFGGITVTDANFGG